MKLLYTKYGVCTMIIFPFKQFEVLVLILFFIFVFYYQLFYLSDKYKFRTLTTSSANTSQKMLYYYLQKYKSIPPKSTIIGHQREFGEVLPFFFFFEQKVLLFIGHPHFVANV